MCESKSKDKNENIENNYDFDTIHYTVKNLHHFHVIVQALTMIFLCQHYENINHDHNLQMFHILSLIKTKICHASIDVHKFIL